jgi:hypothetical protein
MRSNTYNIPSPLLSKKTQHILHPIVQHFQHTQQQWKQYLVSVAEMEPSVFSDEHADGVFRNITYSEIQPIRQQIHDQIREGIHAQFVFGERTVDVYMMFPNWMKGRIQKHQNQYFMRIAMWLNWAFTVASPDCSEKLDVYLFLTDLTKQLPDHSRIPLGSVNVNTAYTTPCNKHTRIILYRYEEWFKVFIHETTHCLGLDFSSVDGEKYDAQILSLFRGCDAKTEVSLTETYTEMWAEIINILFCVVCERENTYSRALTRVRTIRSIRNKRKTIKSPFSWKKMNQKILHRLWIEQQFSVFQCSKILGHYDMTYMELCNGNGENKHKYTENTPVLAYYIIKSILMMNVNAFIEWCATHNRPHPVRMTLSPEVIKSFVSLIQKKYLNSEWIRIIQRAQDALISILHSRAPVRGNATIAINDMIQGFTPGEYTLTAPQPSPHNTKWIYQTLRMTANECV